jgi:hypothetical protein
VQISYEQTAKTQLCFVSVTISEECHTFLLYLTLHSAPSQLQSLYLLHREEKHYKKGLLWLSCFHLESE